MIRNQVKSGLGRKYETYDPAVVTLSSDEEPETDMPTPVKTLPAQQPHAHVFRCAYVRTYATARLCCAV